MNNSNSSDAVLLNSRVQRQVYVCEKLAGILVGGGGGVKGGVLCFITMVVTDSVSLWVITFSSVTVGVRQIFLYHS
jgi:hypothetical protein